MLRYQTTITDRFGNSLRSVIATLRTAAGNLVDLYDEAGLSVPNPLVTTEDGCVEFHAANGKYLMTLEHPEIQGDIAKVVEVFLYDHQTDTVDGAPVTQYTPGDEYPDGTTVLRVDNGGANWPSDTVSVTTHKHGDGRATQLVDTTAEIMTRSWTGSYSVGFAGIPQAMTWEVYDLPVPEFGTADCSMPLSSVSNFRLEGDFEIDLPYEALSVTGGTHEGLLSLGVADQSIPGSLIYELAASSESGPKGDRYVVLASGVELAASSRTTDSGTLRIKRSIGEISFQVHDPTKGKFVEIYSTPATLGPVQARVSSRVPIGSISFKVAPVAIKPERVTFMANGRDADPAFWEVAKTGSFDVAPGLAVSNMGPAGDHSPMAGELSYSAKYRMAPGTSISMTVDLDASNSGGRGAYAAIELHSSTVTYSVKYMRTASGWSARFDSSDPSLGTIDLPASAGRATVRMRTEFSPGQGWIGYFEYLDGNGSVTLIKETFIRAEDLRPVLAFFNGNHERLVASVVGGGPFIEGAIILDEMLKTGNGWTRYARYPVLNDRGQIPGEYLADYWGMGGGGNGSGGGGEIGEEFCYLTLLSSSAFGLCYFDCFDRNDHFSVPGGDPLPTFYSMGSLWHGKPGSTLTSSNVVVGPDVYRSFYLHVEHGVPGLRAEYTLTDPSLDPLTIWYACPPDEIVNIVTGFHELYIRFTWLAEGDIRSYGILHKAQNHSYVSDLRMREYFRADRAYQAQSVIPVPGVGRYTVNGHSLELYWNGLRALPGTDYDELTPTSVRVLRTLAHGDVLEFEEKYGYMDKSYDNRIRLGAEHDLAGRHVFRDTMYPDNIYQLAVVNGRLTVLSYDAAVGYLPTDLQAAIDREHATTGDHLLVDTNNPGAAYRIQVTGGQIVLVPHTF